MMTKNLFVLFGLLTLLSGCTMSHPPPYVLPGSEGLYQGKEVTVGKNENLYTVAQRHKVRMRELIVVNKMTPPYVIKPGQKLYLPTRDRYSAPTPKAAPLVPIDKGYMGPSASRGVPTNTGGITAAPLEPLHATKTAPLPAAKPVEASPIQAAPARAASAPSPTAEKVSPPVITKTTNLSTQVKPRATTDVAEVDLEALGIVEKKEPMAMPATALTNAIPAFGWPVRGTVISVFGPKGKGLDNDGLNIAAPKGAPVKASASGVVAYAGNEMKGFGNLVLIRHEGGWVTAYAHLDRVVVARDSPVAKGDMIGTVGTTGGVGSPQLHFEARQDGKPVDPELVLK